MRTRHLLLSLLLPLAALAFPSFAGAYVYWVNAGGSGPTIGRVGNDGSGADPALIPDPVFGSIAVDSSHLYFTSESEETIARTDLDGGEGIFFPVTFPNLGVIGPGGGTVEAVDAGHIYGVDLEGIARADLDGSNPEPEFVNVVGVIGGIAVYGNYIYWTEYDEGAGEYIGRANLTTRAVDEEFISMPYPPLGESGPKAIAVDANGIYWSWEEGGGSHEGEIGHTGLGGGPPTIDALPGVNVYPTSDLAIEGSELYWCNYREGEGPSIAHAHLEGAGSTIDFHFVPHALAAGIAVNSASAPPPPPPPPPPPANPPATPPPVSMPPSPLPPALALRAPKLKLNPKAGTATVTLTAPGPGTIALTGAGIKHLSKQAKAAGPVSLTVKPTGQSAAQLRKVGKVKVTAKLTFTPTSGSPSSRSVPITLKQG